MSEDQLIFWLFMSIYGVLSIQKTRRRRCRENNGKCNSVKPADLKSEHVFAVDINHNGIYTENEKKINFIKALINHSIKFNSSFLIVGGLSESYAYGLKMLPNIAAVMLGYAYALLIIYPFMYDLDRDDNIQSPYDYLKKRYANRQCVKLACVCVAMFYYFAFASLYLWGCAAIVNVLAPDVMTLTLVNVLLGLYSVMGSFIGGYVQSTGTNISQFLAVLVGILIAIYFTFSNEQSGNMADSFGHILELARDENRTEIFNKNIDLTTRYTLLNQLVSLPLPWCAKLTLFLPNYIKLKSMPSKAKSRLLFVSQIPVAVAFNAVLIVAGALFCFAYFYAQCDPVGRIVTNRNQLGMLWLRSVFADARVPALAGLVFASVVYFALVQHSICMSTIGRTLCDELVKPGEFREDTARRLMSVLVALASIAFASLFQYAKNTMLALFFIFNNSMNSPILGLFLVSMFNPYANHVGVTLAFLLNVAINFWLAIGSLVFSNIQAQELDPKTIYCETNQLSTSMNQLANRTLIEHFDNFHHHQHHNQSLDSNSLLFSLYSVAPIWYCLFSVLFTFSFGSVFSLVYALVKTGTYDCDRQFSDERRKYLFFYRLRNIY